LDVLCAKERHLFFFSILLRLKQKRSLNNKVTQHFTRSYHLAVCRGLLVPLYRLRIRVPNWIPLLLLLLWRVLLRIPLLLLFLRMRVRGIPLLQRKGGILSWNRRVDKRRRYTAATRPHPTNAQLPVHLRDGAQRAAQRSHAAATPRLVDFEVVVHSLANTARKEWHQSPEASVADAPHRVHSLGPNGRGMILPGQLAGCAEVRIHAAAQVHAAVTEARVVIQWVEECHSLLSCVSL